MLLEETALSTFANAEGEEEMARSPLADAEVEEALEHVAAEAPLAWPAPLATLAAVETASEAPDDTERETPSSTCADVVWTRCIRCGERVEATMEAVDAHTQVCNSEGSGGVLDSVEGQRVERPEETWRRFAGRSDGRPGYQFGDIARRIFSQANDASVATAKSELEAVTDAADVLAEFEETLTPSIRNLSDFEVGRDL